VLEVILALSTTDPDHASDCFQLLSNLCEFSIQALIPHLKPVVQVSAQLAGNININESLRCDGINLISTVIRSKKKVSIFFLINVVDFVFQYVA